MLETVAYLTSSRRNKHRHYPPSSLHSPFNYSISTEPAVIAHITKYVYQLDDSLPHRLNVYFVYITIYDAPLKTKHKQRGREEKTRKKKKINKWKKTRFYRRSPLKLYILWNIVSGTRHRQLSHRQSGVRVYFVPTTDVSIRVFYRYI